MGELSSKVVTPTPKTLLLVEDGVSVDITEFDRAGQSDDFEELARAIELYRGPLLEGCAEEWVLTDRQNREETFLQSAEKAAQLASDSGDYSRAVEVLRRAIAVDPFRESSTRSLMEAHAASGDHAAAVVAYRQLRERLLYELNADPSGETTALLERIRKDARVRAQRTAAPIEQLEPAPRAMVTMPTPRIERRRGNLPEPLTEIVGREQDLQEIEAHLMGSRLVTLLGPGGIGKTRLSIETARNLAGEFTGGAWFVDFTPLQDPALVAQMVEHAFGVHERPGRSAADDLVAALGSEPTLLVMDNCEHLIDACAELADRLLKGCGNLRILATSREPLGLVGEIAWRVPTLSFPEGGRVQQLSRQLASALLQYDAVRLFVARAQAASPGFELTLENSGAVVDICQRLDGIALAIELAAARLKVLSVQQISERLNDRFKLLTGGGRGVPTRQQTLRAALEWSYDLLFEQERTLLRRLSVFAGLFTLAAVERVATGEDLDEVDALDLVSKLVDKSLVRLEIGADGKARYRMLETTREYARELLAQSGEEDAVHDRHADYYVSVARRELARLAGPDELDALQLLERVYDNLRGTLQWVIERGDEQRALVVVDTLRYFWSIRDRVAEGRIWIRKALELPGPPSAARAYALQAASHYATLAADYDEARQYAKMGLEMAGQIDDPKAIGQLYRIAAAAASESGDFEAGLNHVAASLRIAKETGENDAIRRSLTASGLIHLDSGDPVAAQDFFRQAIALCEQTESEQLKGWNCGNMGDALMVEGKPQEAMHWYREGLERLSIYAGTHGTCECVRGLCLAAAKATADPDHRRRALALVAAAGRNQGTIGVHLRRFDAIQRDRLLSELRSEMGDADFDQAWSDGMTIEFEEMKPASIMLACEVIDSLAALGPKESRKARSAK